MNWLATLLLGAALLGQANFAPAPPAPGGAAPGGEEPPPLKIRLLALQSTQEDGIAEPFVDPEIKWFKDVLPQLPYNTFVQVAAGETELATDQVTRMPMGDAYDVYLMPQGQAATGELQVRVRITASDGGASVDAIRADAQIALNQVLVFQGLEHKVGDLTCILGLVQDQEGESEQNEEQEEQQQGEEEQERNENEEQQDEQNQDESQDQPEEPKDRQEIEAILDMLEAIDKQEQRDDRERRDPQSVRNPWW